MEVVSDYFTVEQEAAWVFRGTADDRLRNRSGESQAVDAGDLVTVLSDEQAATIQLLLHPVVGVEQELVELLFVDGIEELALDAAMLAGGIWWRGAARVGSCLLYTSRCV